MTKRYHKYKKIIKFLTTIAIILVIFTNAYPGGILEYDGNTWIYMTEKDKTSFIIGFLLENGYICQNNHPMISSDNSYFGFIYKNKNLIIKRWLDATKIINKKAPIYAHTTLSKLLYRFATKPPELDIFFFILDKNLEPLAKLEPLKEAIADNYSNISMNKLKKDYNILTIAYLTNLGMKENQGYLNKIQEYCLYNISVEQFIDGLNNFYQDFRNRNIKLGDAIYIVRRQIMGDDEETIKKIIRFLKTGSFKNTDDFIKNYVNFPP